MTQYEVSLARVGKFTCFARVEDDVEISSEENSESELADDKDKKNESEGEEDLVARHNPFSALTEDCD